MSAGWTLSVDREALHFSLSARSSDRAALLNSLDGLVREPHQPCQRQLTGGSERLAFTAARRYAQFMSREQLAAIVFSDPEVQGGAPVFRGTRVPVKSLFDHLEAGESIDEFLVGFSTVKREQVIALLEFCRADALSAAA